MAKSFKELVSSLNLPVPNQELLQEAEDYEFKLRHGTFKNAQFLYHTRDAQFKTDLLNFTEEYTRWKEKYWPKAKEIFSRLDESEKEELKQILQDMNVMVNTIKSIYKELKS